MTIFIQNPPDTSFRGGIAVPDVLLDAQRKKIPDVYGAGNTINPATLMTGCFEFNSPVPLQRKTGGQPGIVGERLREARAVFNAVLLPDSPEGERLFLYANQQLQNQTVSADPPLEWEAKGRTFYVHPHNPTLHCLGLANRVRIQGQLRWVCTGITPILRVNLPNQPLSIGENVYGGEFPADRQFAQVGFQAIPGAGNIGWRLPPIEVPNLQTFAAWDTRAANPTAGTSFSGVTLADEGSWAYQEGAPGVGSVIYINTRDSRGNYPFAGVPLGGSTVESRVGNAVGNVSRYFFRYGEATPVFLPINAGLHLYQAGTNTLAIVQNQLTGSTPATAPDPGVRPENGMQRFSIATVTI